MSRYSDYPSLPPEYDVDWRDLIFGSAEGICKDCGTDKHSEGIKPS